MKNVQAGLGESHPLGSGVAQAAMESGADALWVEAGVRPEVKKMGLIPTVAEDGDLMLGRDVVEKEVRDKKDEEEIVSLSLQRKVVVKGGDWTIIPLENLLSRTGNLFVEIAGHERRANGPGHPGKRGGWSRPERPRPPRGSPDHPVPQRGEREIRTLSGHGEAGRAPGPGGPGLRGYLLFHDPRERACWWGTAARPSF